jgi:hypothetical protein
MSVGTPRTSSLPVTALVRGSMRETVRSWVFSAQTAPSLTATLLRAVGLDEGGDLTRCRVYDGEPFPTVPSPEPPSSPASISRAATIAPSSAHGRRRPLLHRHNHADQCDSGRPREGRARPAQRQHSTLRPRPAVRRSRARSAPRSWLPPSAACSAAARGRRCKAADRRGKSPAWLRL